MASGAPPPGGQPAQRRPEAAGAALGATRIARGRGARCRSGSRRVVTAGRRRLEERILAQDGLLEFLERGARSIPSLPGRERSGPAGTPRAPRPGAWIGRAPASAGLAALPQRVLGHQGLHLADEIRNPGRALRSDSTRSSSATSRSSSRRAIAGWANGSYEKSARGLPTPQRERRAQEPRLPPPLLAERARRARSTPRSKRATSSLISARLGRRTRVDGSRSRARQGRPEPEPCAAGRRRPARPSRPSAAARRPRASSDEAVGRHDLVRSQQDGKQRPLLRSSARHVHRQRPRAGRRSRKSRAASSRRIVGERITGVALVPASSVVPLRAFTGSLPSLKRRRPFALEATEQRARKGADMRTKRKQILAGLAVAIAFRGCRGSGRARRRLAQRARDRYRPARDDRADARGPGAALGATVARPDDRAVRVSPGVSS